MSGPVQKETRPTLTFFGTLPAKSDIALRRGQSRVGFTSFARIEPETSTSSTTVARSDVTCTVALRAGDAPPTRPRARAGTARAGSSAGQRRRCSTTDASRSRFVNATA